jgi:PAS domain S-box-containing protein
MLATSLLFETAADAVLFIATDGQVIDGNPNALELLGYTRNELLAMNILHFVAPEFHAMTRKMMDEKNAGCRRTIYESSFLTKAGAIIPVEVNDLRPANGSVIQN